MNLSPFDIPHLNEGVTQYLSTHDLKQCVLASKEWLERFTPALWRTIDIKATYLEQMFSGLVRHRTHVRSITSLDKNLNLSGFTFPIFPNLKSLHYSTKLDLTHECDLFRYLSTAESLQSFTMTLTATEGSKILIDLLALHPNLQELDLTIYNMYNIFDSMFIPQLLQACPNCCTLRLRLFDFYSRTESEDGNKDIYQESVAAIERLQEMSAREFCVRLSSVTQWQVMIVPLLRCFPLLERFELRGLDDTDALHHIAGAFREGACPRLKSLSFVEVNCFEGDPATEILQALGYRGGYSSYIGNGSGTTGSGLNTFGVYRTPRFSPLSARMLTDSHAGTLTVLNLNSLYPVPFSIFVNAVKNLPKLQSLEAKIWLGLESVSIGAADIEVSLQSSWSCLELRTIKISAMCRYEFYPIWKNSLADKCSSHLFEQIGRLRNLREWTVRNNVEMLTMRKGYLSRLSGLKQLRSLELNESIKFILGREEAEWMILNWPKFIHVSISGLEGKGGFISFEDTLLLGRPWMQIEH